MHNLLKYNLLAWLLLTMPCYALAKDIDAGKLFKQGNEAYAKNQFSEAATAYQQLLNAGYQSAAVYFNLGNANYKLSEMPRAILNYERALKLSPGDEEIQLNLQLANLKITDRIEEVPEFFLTRWWKGLIYFFSLHTLSVLTVVCFIAGFSSVIAYLFLVALGPKKRAFYVGITLLALGLTFMVISGLQSYYLGSSRQGIILAGAVDVKSGPGDQQKTLFVIHEGIKVNIQEGNTDWVKVVLANGNGGWIKSSSVTEI